MLMYGTYQNIPDIQNLDVYNLSSYIQRFPVMRSLIPPDELGITSSKDFDMNYYQYIFSNDMVFLQFFRIMQSIYSGKDVYILSNTEDWAENLIESLFKIIQQRYGYNGVQINSFEDYMSLYMNDYGFTDWGLINLDQDKQRYSYLVNRMQTQNTKENIKQYYV